MSELKLRPQRGRTQEAGLKDQRYMEECRERAGPHGNSEREPTCNGGTWGTRG
jgi:hypothetical protein